MAIKKPGIEEKEVNSIESKEIPFDIKNEQPDTVTVDFQEEDIASEFAAQPTKESKDTTIDPNTPIEKLQSDIKGYEESKSGKLEYKDLYQQAEFIINLLDTGLSTLFNFIAKDTSITAYQMPVTNKRLLTQQLTLILAKYQSKFSIEFLFFSGLIVLYAPMGIAAVKNRKANSKRPYNKKEEKIETKLDNLENKEVEKKEDEIRENINVPKIRRKAGKQPKAF